MRESMYKILLCLMVIFSFGNLNAQSDSIPADTVIITGMVKDVNGYPILNAIIVNQSTYSGVFGNMDGSFSIEIEKDHKLAVRSIGKETVFFSFADSLLKEEYFLNIVLKDLQINISKVTIFAPRELDDIYDDIEDLGYSKNDFVLSGIDAAMSPITFLYQQFSKLEKEKRLAAELTNADLKRDLLKELFVKYADYDIVDLDDDEFDDFIDFLNVSDSFIKSASQYEFIVYVKQRFAEYQIYSRNRELKDEDYNYDQD